MHLPSSLLPLFPMFCLSSVPFRTLTWRRRLPSVLLSHPAIQMDSQDILYSQMSHASDTAKTPLPPGRPLRHPLFHSCDSEEAPAHAVHAAAACMDAREYAVRCLQRIECADFRADPGSRVERPALSVGASWSRMQWKGAARRDGDTLSTLGEILEGKCFEEKFDSISVELRMPPAIVLWLWHMDLMPYWNIQPGLQTLVELGSIIHLIPAKKSPQHRNYYSYHDVVERGEFCTVEKSSKMHNKEGKRCNKDTPSKH
ncbi:hypothetical protein B0H17DRAFT_1130032 [Mycena rosella]|uniref:Uncharacterized protein n=1 Tax=Mycena rosella TaxID=1033263 RepID=A0AAD7GP10_MYCRO|nr:hypothetical protein B0H17DRAFT_1130032 [Mycena rosella]